MHVSPVDQFSCYFLGNLKHFFFLHEILKRTGVTYAARRTSYANFFTI
jgi:hypothetical protein